MNLLGMEKAQILSADPTVAEKISRFVTNPFVAPVLLTIGIAGLITALLVLLF